MTVRVRVMPEAVVDLHALAAEYESKAPGLGIRFTEAFLRNVGHGESFPRIGPTFYRGIRKLLLRPFKVILFYRVWSAHIQVLALMDGRDDPRRIRRRLRSL